MPGLEGAPSRAYAHVSRKRGTTRLTADIRAVHRRTRGRRIGLFHVCHLIVVHSSNVAEWTHTPGWSDAPLDRDTITVLCIRMHTLHEASMT
ncbi:hypothetical protein CFBP7900_06090 [Xanthomonas hortorum pv. carotae]|uniref:Uncharacterized protein n=1 Tax=Xanthomonas hortorum pv. carotae TaxID=487904 RepID=A0A6V7C1V6_9XANT|nr:hypothetical protein CFBP7900_06090 [Xanthomonas hortorum pv. carotae]CAD0308063.1 hypothetical protein CFBP7900_06090 [Xanthomonas hortorum pv. carotae]